MLIGELEALLTNETLPLSVPVAGGVKVKINDALVPAASVIGRVSPESLYPDPLTLTCERVRAALPVLLIAMDREDELPTTTLPKLTDVGLNARTAEDEPEPVPPELPEGNAPVVPHPVIAMIESEA